MSDYEDCALIYVGFTCDKCNVELTPQDVSVCLQDVAVWPSDFGEKAKELGWYCSYNEDRQDCDVLCPKCYNEQITSQKRTTETTS